MRKNKIGIFTLAISLIIIGLIFLVNNFTSLQVWKILSIFWPLIIIILGLELIINRVIINKNDKEDKIPISYGSIVILIVLVIIISLTSNIVLNIPSINLGKYGIHIGESFVLGGNYTYDSTFSEDKIINVSSEKELIVENEFGSIDVEGYDNDKISIESEIVMQHNNEEYAKKIANNIIDINQNKDMVNISSNIRKYIKDRSKVGSIEVNFTIKVPKNMKLDLDNNFGRIDVKSINKKVSIDNEHGDVDISYIDSNVEVRNKHGKVNIDTVSKQLEVINSFGDIEVNNVSESAYISNSHDDIYISDVKGDLEINGSFSKIQVKDIKGNLDIKDNNENIYLNNIKGKVYIDNQYGDIEIQGIEDLLDITNKNGDISINSKEILKENIDIDNKYGDVYLKLPQEQEGDFIIFTRYGHIENDLNLEVKEDTNEETIKQSIGSSNIKLNVTTKNGDVNLRIY